MRNQTDENMDLREALSELTEDVPPMPENLHAAWMQKVTEDPYKQTRTDSPRTWKGITRFLSVAAAMVFIIGGTLLTRDNLSGLTGGDLKSAQNEGSYSLLRTNAASDTYTYGAELYEEEYAMDTGVMLTAARGAGTDSELLATPTTESTAAATEKKIIRTASLNIVTQTYDDSLAALKASCEGLNGWIEASSENVNSYTGLRTAYLTLRIPQTALDGYIAATDDLGRITSRSETATDVTESYQDTRTRLDTQLALMERLKALINESGDLSDLLALESQIADTQYQIDRLQSSLNRTDRQVTYSTVDITLREEKTVELTDTSVSLGERLMSALQVGMEALGDFLMDTVVFLAAALPFIAIVGMIVIVLIVIRKRRN